MRLQRCREVVTLKGERQGGTQLTRSLSTLGLARLQMACLCYHLLPKILLFPTEDEMMPESL
jgi:hypothetical protein